MNEQPARYLTNHRTPNLPIINREPEKKRKGDQRAVVTGSRAQNFHLQNMQERVARPTVQYSATRRHKPCIHQSSPRLQAHHTTTAPPSHLASATIA
ncbi:hypothetical protein CC80DRAFT_492359 [Byssothecium circinans]|uniref:Uncharacterized protein n=1 Tax=Byssothecium circinans TaxID=147558 RepID=A0A6A5TWF9_9PLEO|nr:hypothetical protein CC80DRAFT_492359 [Byssothecium circinans]